MRKDYATQLTKEELIKGGITLITEDGLVFKGETQVIPTVNAAGYLMLSIYDLDEEGNKIKKPIIRKDKRYKNPINTYIYKFRTVGLHRAMWAWFNEEVPTGYVVDHINNKHTALEDYHLSNLQLLTPGQNLAKEKDESTRMIKCKLNKPLSFYEDKLSMYVEKYEEAKKNKDAELAHKLRSNIANARARIRYYMAHIDEANTVDPAKVLKANILKKRSIYNAALAEYGPDDHWVLQFKYDWKLAIYEYKKWLEENAKPAN